MGSCSVSLCNEVAKRNYEHPQAPSPRALPPVRDVPGGCRGDVPVTLRLGARPCLTGKMHYTFPENIHKVIDPLFLDDLKAELQAIGDTNGLTPCQRNNCYRAFHEKLCNLRFLETYCSDWIQNSECLALAA